MGRSMPASGPLGGGDLSEPAALVKGVAERGSRTWGRGGGVVRVAKINILTLRICVS